MDQNDGVKTLIQKYENLINELNYREIKLTS